jgi:type I restriction enzyme S subunit
MGQLPEDWEVVPAKALFDERKSKSLPSDVHLTPSQTHGVLPQAEYMERTGNKVVLNLNGADAMRHVEPNDFISHLRSFQGGLEYSPLTGKVSAAYTVLRPEARVVPAFFRYLFKSSRYIQALQTTTDQLRDGQSIRFAQFTLIPLPLPDVLTQTLIASFLDRETAEIDAFIADQEELIRLLAERRAATISHAVTKGLDPSAPLKDSGVEWLGEIPAHWTATRTSRFFRVTLGKMLDAGKVVGADSILLPYIRAANIQEAGLDLRSVNEMQFTVSECRSLDIRRGDLLVVEGGAVGVNVHITEDMTGWSFQKTVNRMRSTSSEMSPRFLGFAIDALRWSGVIDMLSNKSTIAHLTAEKLERMVVAFPPKAEQEAIVTQLEHETREIDEAIADAREAIALLRERRAALISAAVTGKIDVRNHGEVA